MNKQLVAVALFSLFAGCWISLEGCSGSDAALPGKEPARSPLTDGEPSIPEKEQVKEALDATLPAESAARAPGEKDKPRQVASLPGKAAASAAAEGSPPDPLPQSPAQPASSTAAVFHGREGDWPMWGGSPGRNMVNDREKSLPATWDLKSKKNIKWVVPLGSQSYGNPVVAAGKIFVGTNNQAEKNPKIKGDKGIVMCFQESDGKFLWQAVHDKLESGRVNDWPDQGICSCAAVEDGRVYYVSNRAEVVCADVEGFLDGKNDGPFKEEKYTSPLDGDFIWVLDMMEELGVFPHNLIVNDLVYVVTSNGVEKDHITIPSPRAPSFIAINKKTGKLVWESSAPGEKIIHGQWSSPCFGVVNGRAEVIFPGGDGWLRGFEPLKGKVLWEFDCNPKDAVYELGGKGTKNEIISTPVCVDGKVYVAVGQDPEHGEGIGHLYSVDASRDGDVTPVAQVWQRGGKDFHRTISTVAVKDGLVYAADLSGFFYCLDQQTGQLYWMHDMLAAIWGSPMWADGKVYLGDEDGDVVVFKAGKKLEILGEMNLDNAVYSTPVAAHGVLYIANRTHLFAIEEKK